MDDKKQPAPIQGGLDGVRALLGEYAPFVEEDTLLYLLNNINSELGGKIINSSISGAHVAPQLVRQLEYAYKGSVPTTPLHRAGVHATLTAACRAEAGFGSAAATGPLSLAAAQQVIADKINNLSGSSRGMSFNYDRTGVMLAKTSFDLHVDEVRAKLADKKISCYEGWTTDLSKLISGGTAELHIGFPEHSAVITTVRVPRIYDVPDDVVMDDNRSRHYAMTTDDSGQELYYVDGCQVNIVSNTVTQLGDIPSVIYVSMITIPDVGGGHAHI